MDTRRFWRNTFLTTLLGAMGLVACSAPAAVLDTFTYQGELLQAGEPVSDVCDFQFRLYDADADGTQVGPQVQHLNIAVVDGKIIADLDFGPGAFNGGERWIEIDVRCPSGEGEFVTLAPRQPVTPAPYALKSLGNTMSWVDYTDQVRTDDAVGIGTGNDSAQSKLHVKASDSNIPNSFLWGDDLIVEEKTGDTVLGLYSDSTDRSAITFGTTFASQGQTKWSMFREGQFLNFDWGGGDLGQGERVVTIKGTTIDPALGVATSSPQSTFQVANLFHVDNLDGFVGVNREAEITSAEVFGITRVGTGYGGMYVETANSSRGGRPFYGYAVDGDAEAWTYFDAASATWRLNAGGERLAVNRSTGHVGIGTTLPQTRLQVVGGDDASPTGGGFIVAGPLNTLNVAIDNNEIMARDNGQATTLHLNADGGDVRVGQNSGGDSKLITPVIQITGGSDFSEMFDVGGDVEPLPGMVVVIDPAAPGRLIPSRDPYDPKVAGVISGAGGVGTGMTMGHDGTIADGEHPVALSGRVYCLVDATEHAIQPGDMLTTSSVPGHAMKATDRSRAHGTVIGKAMTALPKGETGLVLVLVNLQ